MNVEIITIGDEILIGQIVDTNSAWMAQELNKEGFVVVQISSVSDDKNHIKASIKSAFSRADIVLMTGGIGPTKDDITKQTLCEYFDTELVFSEEVFLHVTKIINSYNGSMNDLNRSQAYVPRDCIVINNEVGTAPITWFNKQEKVLVSMPGVPSEMKWAMSSEIIPRLKSQYKNNTLVHKHFLVHGYPESTLALKLENWENNLPDYIHLAYLPSIGLVKLRLTSEQQDAFLLENEMNKHIQALRDILGTNILFEEDIPIEVWIGKILKEKGLMLATAESCTGGNIAKMITSVAGSSDYFKGSVVAYHNDIKQRFLDVSVDDLEKHGAVSLPVVEQMARGVLNILDCDLAVATSGIAGPTGGSDEKPVGTVCIAVANKHQVLSKQFHFGTIRERNITRSTLTSFVLIKEFIDAHF